MDLQLDLREAKKISNISRFPVCICTLFHSFGFLGQNLFIKFSKLIFIVLVGFHVNYLFFVEYGADFFH